MKYILDRAREPSTYRGFFLLLTAVGVTVTPELGDAVTAVGLGLAGLIGVLFPDISK